MNFLFIKISIIMHLVLTFNQASISTPGRTSSSDSALERGSSVGRIWRKATRGYLVHALQQILWRWRGPVVVVDGVLRRGRIQDSFILQGSGVSMQICKRRETWFIRRDLNSNAPGTPGVDDLPWWGDSQSLTHVKLELREMAGDVWVAISEQARPSIWGLFGHQEPPLFVSRESMDCREIGSWNYAMMII